MRRMVGFWLLAALAGVVAGRAQPAPAQQPVEVAKFTEHAGDVYRLAISADRTLLATAGKDKLVCVLEAKTLKRLKKYGPHAGEVRGVAILKNRDVFVGTLREPGQASVVRWLWDEPEDQSPRALAMGDTSMFDFHIALDERWMAGLTAGENVAMVPLPERGKRHNLAPRDPDQKCRAIFFLPRNKEILIGRGGGMALWQAGDEMKPVSFLYGENESLVTGISAMRDGHPITCHADGMLRTWTFETDRPVHKFRGHDGAATAIAVSPEGSYAATGGVDKLIRVWDIAARTKVREIAGHAGPVTAVAWVSDTLLASSGQDGAVRLWSLDSKAKPVAPMPTPPTPGPATIGPRRERLPMPAEKDIADAVKLAQSLFAEDYAKAKRPADKEKLITQLLTQAGDLSATAADRCALLQESLRLAAEASLAPTALKAAGQLDATFELPPALRQATATRLAEIAVAPKDNENVAKLGLGWAEELRQAERFAEADQLTRVAGRAAVKSRSAETLEAAKALLARVQSEQERWTSFEAATVAFAKKPDDPLPRVAIGRYFAFNRGDWAKGMTHFSKGPDGPLKELAAKELAPVPDPAAVAEAWLAAAASLPPADLPHCQAAALFWLEKALPAASGLQKLRVQQEIKKLGTPSVVRK